MRAETKTHYVVLAALTTAALFVTGVVPAAAAPIRECGNFDGLRWTYREIQGAGIWNVTSRVVGCRTARRMTSRAYRTYRGGRAWRYRAWTCRILVQKHEYSDTRCTASGGRVVRWQSGVLMSRLALSLAVTLVASSGVATSQSLASLPDDSFSGVPVVRTAVVRDCPGNRPLARTGAWYGDLSVRNMSCRRARRALGTARFRGRRIVIRGWSCKTIGYYQDGGIFRCTQYSDAMRFSAGG